MASFDFVDEFITYFFGSDHHEEFFGLVGFQFLLVLSSVCLELLR